jgi:hypothetical protein
MKATNWPTNMIKDTPRVLMYVRVKVRVDGSGIGSCPGTILGSGDGMELFLREEFLYERSEVRWPEWFGQV